ncbi:MAG: phosphoglycerate dehydrogenase [Desulfovibrio sp.]|jgi:D-3-phosphoglycerate dehydrogenase|nr:phosphoglycerate dehydrogenase [Desulfovibrio sp.]
MQIGISTTTFAEYDEGPLRLLRGAGFEIKRNSAGRALTEDEALEFLSGCVGLIAGTEPLSAKVMDANPQLAVISRCGTGLDNVDLEAARKRGLIVKNTPDAPTAAVAELTLGLALNLARKVCQMDREVRDGRWKKRMGGLMAGKRSGIVGFGRIGRKVAGYFSVLGCEVVFYDPFVPAAENFRRVELDDLLASSDIVTLHCPPRPDGRPVLGEAELGAMKAGALLINAARGGLADEQALCACLRAGALAGAALDVFSREPYPADGELASFPNVILTPHIGAYAVETRVDMEIESARNLLLALRHCGNGPV